MEHCQEHCTDDKTKQPHDANKSGGIHVQLNHHLLHGDAAKRRTEPCEQCKDDAEHNRRPFRVVVSILGLFRSLLQHCRCANQACPCECNADREVLVAEDFAPGKQQRGEDCDPHNAQALEHHGQRGRNVQQGQELERSGRQLLVSQRIPLVIGKRWDNSDDSTIVRFDLDSFLCSFFGVAEDLISAAASAQEHALGFKSFSE
eukprot:2538352-Rhodomonas_salina.2